MYINNITNLNDQERLDLFATMNNKELELLMHHASVELQERDIVDEGDIVANERLIWK